MFYKSHNVMSFAYWYNLQRHKEEREGETFSFIQILVISDDLSLPRIHNTIWYHFSLALDISHSAGEEFCISFYLKKSLFHPYLNFYWDIINIAYIPLFKVCNSAVFRMFAKLCQHHHWLIPESSSFLKDIFL